MNDNLELCINCDQLIAEHNECCNACDPDTHYGWCDNTEIKTQNGFELMGFANVPKILNRDQAEYILLQHEVTWERFIDDSVTYGWTWTNLNEIDSLELSEFLGY